MLVMLRPNVHYGNKASGLGLATGYQLIGRLAADLGVFVAYALGK